MSNRIHSIRRVIVTAVVLSAALATFADTCGAQTPNPAIVEQYKAYMADLGNIGARYSTAQAFYVSIISSLVAIISTMVAIFTFKDSEKRRSHKLNAGFLVACGLVFFSVSMMCDRWAETLDFYKKIFDLKFMLLAEMEAKNQILYPIFTHEAAMRPKPGLIDRDAAVALQIAKGAFVLAITMLVGAVISWFLPQKPRRRQRNNG